MNRTEENVLNYKYVKNNQGHFLWKGNEIRMEEYSDFEADYEEESQEDLCTIYDNIIKNAVAEQCSLISSQKFLEIQADTITELNRKHEIEWILHTHQSYNMAADILYSSLMLFDIFLCSRPVSYDMLRKISCACLIIGCKIEERDEKSRKLIIKMLDNHVVGETFQQLEIEILKTIDFKLSYPTSKLFLRRTLEMVHPDQKKHETAHFFLELSLQYIDFFDFLPSVIAASAMSLAFLCENLYIIDKTKVRECMWKMLEKSVDVIKNPYSGLYARYTMRDMSLVLSDLNISPQIIPSL